MKLLMGCGKKKMAGWLGVDIDKANDPDILDDMVLLSSIKPGSVSSIKVQHALEHLTFSDALKALNRWFVVLVEGGDLSIELPNLDRCYEMITSTNPDERQYGINGIYGDFSNYYLLHKHAWTFESLKHLLLEIGFKNIERSFDLERSNKAKKYNRDMRVIAIK